VQLGRGEKMESEKVVKKEEGRKEHPDRDAGGSRGYRVCGVPVGVIAARNLPYSRSAPNARIKRPVADYAMHLPSAVTSAETEIAKLFSRRGHISDGSRERKRERRFANGVLEFPRFALWSVHVRREPTRVSLPLDRVLFPSLEDHVSPTCKADRFVFYAQSSFAPSLSSSRKSAA